MPAKKTTKKVAKKAVKKAKPTAKKAPAKTKKTAKKTSKKAVKKTAEAPAKKKTAKKVAKKKAVKKPAEKSDPAKTTKSAIRTRPVSIIKKSSAKRSHKLSAKEKRMLKARLIELRDRLSGQISSLKEESLLRNDSVVSVEDGTDAFDRQFALNIVSSENDALFEVDEALRRLDGGTYGVCEECECIIDVPRLSALPFVRMCIKCQSEAEKANRRYHHFDVRRNW